MIQIRENELVHPDLIRRAVAGQDETGGRTVTITMQSGETVSLTGDDAAACWAELQRRRVGMLQAADTIKLAAPKSQRKTRNAPTAPESPAAVLPEPAHE